MYQKFITKFNAISFSIIVVVCALMPFLFLPGNWGGLGAVKGVFLYVGVFVAFSFWLLAQFVDGSLSVPKHRVFLLLGVWVVFSLVSALTSKNVAVSLWGRGFPIDSFATVLVLAMFAFLVATYAREQKKLIKLFLAAFSGSVITVLLQVILYISQNVPFISKYLSHIASRGTLVGSWVDFAHFVTFTFILSLLMYEVLMPKGFFKFLSLFAMILSIVVLVFLNFKVAWMVTIVSALLVFVYKSSVERSVAKIFPQHAEEGTVEEKGGRFPIMSFGALIVGLFFFLSTNSIGAHLSSRVGIIFSDIRPSFAATTEVVKKTMFRDPIFGVGAGRFEDAWNMYHPIEINQTRFWNTSFDSGYSLLETTLATNGLLVTAALVFVLIITLLHGFKLFNYQFPDRFSRFIAVTALIMMIAFVALFTFSSPGIVLVIFGFMYLGLLLGVSSMVGMTKVISINYLRDPRLSFFAILVLVIATMTGFTAAYFSGNKFASIMIYNRAISSNDFQSAISRIDQALSLSQNDIYWRTRVAMFAREFSKIADAQSPDKSLLQTYFSQAEQSARAAVAWDTNSANNWLSLSQVYQLVSSKENEEAFTNAKQAGDEAKSKSPMNPVFLLNQAQIALTKSDVESAYSYIDQALALKSDYLDAFLLKAQIRAAQGESNAFRDEINNYLKIAPFDERAYMLLGQAHITRNEFKSSLDAYNQARRLNPVNPNAYLGIINSLILMGEKTQAIEVLETFRTLFPNISGVDEKITEIKNGKSTPVLLPEVETAPVSNAELTNEE